MNKQTQKLLIIGAIIFVLLGDGLIWFYFSSSKTPASDDQQAKSAGEEILSVEKSSLPKGVFPAVFPAKFPADKGDSVREAYTAKVAGKDNQIFWQYTSPRSPMEISSTYKNFFSKNEWRINATLSQETLYYLAAENPENGHKAYITMDRNSANGTSTVSVAYSYSASPVSTQGNK